MSGVARRIFAIRSPLLTHLAIRIDRSPIHTASLSQSSSHPRLFTSDSLLLLDSSTLVLHRSSLPVIMSHQHSSGCACSEDQKQSDAITESLYSSIDIDRIRCFNEAVHDSGRRCIKPFSDRNNDQRLLSDPSDGEMLLVIPFITDVHIKTITIMAWADWQPKKIKLSAQHDTTAARRCVVASAAHSFSLMLVPQLRQP